ncbi:MAG: sulfite exporter TauE/SafE family protein [Pyrinomonadaceae bacterium MAG19_C2-C3]|nr:sulfite exporter TauE/SafE family protein [Pyrinomonadaceae bacterium MAG19_C2-C3]
MDSLDLLHAAAAFVAAFLAGTINAVAGGGTLITFPILLWLGLDSKVANATSTVALYPGLFGGLWGYRRDVRGAGNTPARLGAISLIGGAVGAWLLIKTPTNLFDALIPFLILFATLLFMVQEYITRFIRKDDAMPNTEATIKPRSAWWMTAGMLVQFCSAIYGGYFGAGNGILMLTLLGFLGFRDIHQANGIKNFLAICLNTVAVVLFSISGMVRWWEALIMATGAIAGGYFGARTAQRFGKRFVRRAVVGIGLTITFVMLWRLRHQV